MGLSSTNDKLASLKTAFQVVNKEKDDAISQLKSLQKESENRNDGKMGKKGVEKDDFSDDYFQIQCDRLKKELADAVKDLDVANAEAVDYKARYTSLLKRSDQMSADLETARIDLSSLSGTNASLEEMLQQRSSSIEDALEQARSNRKDLELEINSLREILKDKDVQLNRIKE